jgi:hypothetical protein
VKGSYRCRAHPDALVKGISSLRPDALVKGISSLRPDALVAEGRIQMSCASSLWRARRASVVSRRCESDSTALYDWTTTCKQ